MEQDTILKEILKVLKMHGKQMDQKFAEMDQRFERMDQRSKEMDQKMDQKLASLKDEMQEGFTQVNQRIARLDDKFTGVRADLTETQETTNYLLSKSAQHEKKIQQIINQQQS
jgi:septal ring factor EnvC (AmiA/AmiB activator)